MKRDVDVWRDCGDDVKKNKKKNVYSFFLFAIHVRAYTYARTRNRTQSETYTHAKHMAIGRKKCLLYAAGGRVCAEIEFFCTREKIRKCC